MTDLATIAHSISNLGISNKEYFESDALQSVEVIQNLLNRDTLSDKLEGMKRCVALMSIGSDIRQLYPHVVKNVITEHPELQKLVNIFITHYAELEPDNALLSINAFQNQLKSPNQLTRALALKVLTSIRVRSIAAIQMMSIKKCSTDMSPYVRKTCAHSLTKVLSLDPNLHDEVLEILEVLIKDASMMVLGSALAAFNQICPTNFELIHPVFRKLCRLLADIDEWGQILIVNILLRYARTQFLNPDGPGGGKKKKKKKTDGFYTDSDSEGSFSGSESEDEDWYDNELQMDPDHRLLLQSTAMLLFSRNAGVVLAVSSMYYHIAPRVEAQKVGKSLVRIMRSHREVEYIVLSNIASMCTVRPELFQSYLSDFFVFASDPPYVRNLKLEILTNLANEMTITRILREFNSYVRYQDKDFVTRTIQAIGNAASKVDEVADICLNGLVALLYSPNDDIVAEAVVVIKELLHMKPDDHVDVIKQLVRMFDRMENPRARAAITWLVGEHPTLVSDYAPDLLRKLCKSFPDEDDAVKLQALSTGARLFFSLPQQTRPFFKHILTQAKYDVNYDIRDRARLMRGVVFNANNVAPTLHQQYARRLFVTTKPKVERESESERRLAYVHGSLAHLLNHTTNDYQPLPEWPLEAPDSEPRNVTPIEPERTGYRPQAISSDDPRFSQGGAMMQTHITPKFDEDFAKGFYSSDESGSYSGSYSGSESGSFSGSYSDSYSGSYSDSGSFSSDFSDDEGAPSKQPGSNNLLDDIFGGSAPSSGNTMGTTGGDFFSQPAASSGRRMTAGGSATGVRQSLLVSGPLEIEYAFARRPSMYGPTFAAIQLYLKNNDPARPVHDVKIGTVAAANGQEVKPFDPVTSISPGGLIETTLNVKFASSTQPVRFDLTVGTSTHRVTLQPSVGDLMMPKELTPAEADTQQKRLGGMNEASASVNVSTLSDSEIVERVNAFAWVATVRDGQPGMHRFSGINTKKDLVLIVVDKSAGVVRVSSTDPIFANTFVGVIAKAL